MRQFRYLVKLFKAFFWKFKGILLLSTILGTVFILTLTQLSAFFPWFERGEIIGVVGRFTSEEVPFSIQSQISTGLTKVDKNGEVVSGLAKSWRLEEKGKVWIFELGDFNWQDGKKVVATDINYKFSDVTSEVIDEKTIKFVLKDPFAPFPSVVSRPIFKSGLLGTGEWEVTNLSLIGGRYIESLKLMHTKMDKSRTYKFYPTEEAARLSFKLGEVDVLQEIVDPKDIKTWLNVNVSEISNQDRYVGIFINNSDPILSEKSLRQALAYAVNKDVFSEERAISPIAPNSWAFNPQVKQYPYNPERAKELLKVLPKEQLENLNINLVTSPTLLSIADKIKADWDAIGVKTHLQVFNTPPSDFQALLAIQAIPPDPDQYSLWHSTQVETNITRYRNSRESQRIDKLLEDGRKTLDQEERRKIYIDFQRFLLEESPVIFLYHPITYTLTRK